MSLDYGYLLYICNLNSRLNVVIVKGYLHFGHNKNNAILRLGVLRPIRRCLGTVPCDACPQLSPRFRPGFHLAALSGI